MSQTSVLSSDLEVWIKQTLAVNEALKPAPPGVSNETLLIVAALLVLADRVDAVAAYTH